MDIREQFERLVATWPDLPCKGKASRYSSRNGNMFAFVTKEGAIALRLGEPEREAFCRKWKTGPVVQYGAVMRGYVEVPAALLARPKDLVRCFAQSVAFAHTLPAKATTRQPATTKTPAKTPAKKPARKAARKAAGKKARK